MVLSSISSWITTLLITAFIVQWIYFTLILNERHIINNNQYQVSSQKFQLQLQQLQNDYRQLQNKYTVLMQQQQQQQQELNNQQNVIYNNNKESNSNSSTIYDGVFVTVLHRPSSIEEMKLQNTYTTMLQNAIGNIPRNGKWTIQVFIDDEYAQKYLYPFQPTLYRLLNNNNNNNNNSTIHIIKTILPSNLTTTASGQKSITIDEIYKSLWFWKMIVANAVVLFTSNGAFCTNHIEDPIVYWSRMALTIDYCGIPTSPIKEVVVVVEEDGTTTTINKKVVVGGGDGSTHSFRNRIAMIRVLQYQQQQQQQQVSSSSVQAQSTSEIRTGSEWYSTLETMIKINQEIIATTSAEQQEHLLFRIASYNDTIQFGSVYNVSNDTALLHLPYIVSGTILKHSNNNNNNNTQQQQQQQHQLTYAERDSIIKHCPEIKLIIPSLHEPNCFGAHPNPIDCKATICALQQPIPSTGCY